jgi:hypothetical protein
MKIRSLYEVFADLPDPRTAQGQRYGQAGVLALVTLALMAQQNSLRQIAAWVDAQDPALGARLGFRFGRMPSYGTLRRMLLGLDLDHLRRSLQAWAQELTHGLPVTDAPPQPLIAIAIDGKTLRGSANAAEQTPAVRLLSAFVHDLGATLAQQPIAVTTNELGTLPQLLGELVLSGTIATLDAHYTNREVARTIRKKGGIISCA